VAETDFNQLITELATAPEAAARAAAARKLADLRDTKAIAYLAGAYRNERDEKVRKAVENALRTYRSMEQAQKSGAPAATGGLPAARLQGLRRALLIALAVTVALNVLLLVLRSGGGAAIVGTATPRETLIAAYQTVIGALGGEAPQLRTLFTTFQADYSVGSVPRCEPLFPTTASLPPLGDFDKQTYPDIAALHEQTVLTLTRYLGLRTDYQEVCAIKDYAALQRRLVEEGDAVGLVAQIDQVLNQDLNGARVLMNRAVNSPAPTVGPSATPVSAWPAPSQSIAVAQHSARPQ
jgi:hypothetical protein